MVRQIVGRCSRGLTFSYWSPTRFFRIGERPVVVIWRRNGAVDVIVRSADCAVDQRRTLEGTAAEKLLSAVLATHADTWTEPFEPEDPVLDGYSWSMTVYAGLPLAWDGEEIAFACANEKGDHE